MKTSTKHEGRSAKWLARLLAFLLPYGLFAEDFSRLCADRTTIEQVYYNHRQGRKPPFEQVSPPSLIERLVKEDLCMEAVLLNAYGVEITPIMLDAEVQRINTTTRAPERLAEIKAMLDNDPARFAEAFAKPFLVERLLRNTYENDDARHSDGRRECEQARNNLLAAKNKGATATELLVQLKQGHSDTVTETTWKLGTRPDETDAPTADELEIKKRYGPEAKILSSPQNGETGRQFYFEDLPALLQEVLRAQLRQPGDVSAVIETPGGFLLYICEQRTHEMLSVACLSLPKCSYEQWLNEQSGGIE